MGQVLLHGRIANCPVDVDGLGRLDEVVGEHHFQDGYALLSVFVSGLSNIS